jgi:ABC-type lipoprotein release transport system permease subunit
MSSMKSLRAMIVVLGAMALVAASVPALRASRLDPTRARRDANWSRLPVV